MPGIADTVLVACILHFGTYTIGDVKKFLAEKIFRCDYDN